MLALAPARVRAASPSDYADAREFFAAVRDAAREAGRIQSTAHRMQDSEGLCGSGGFEPRVRSTNSDPSGMSRVDARIDFEAANARRLEEDYALIDAACAVIYGRDGHGDGLERLMGSAVSDCMWWRFCAAESWAVVAEACGYPRARPAGSAPRDWTRATSSGGRTWLTAPAARRAEADRHSALHMRYAT